MHDNTLTIIMKNTAAQAAVYAAPACTLLELCAADLICTSPGATTQEYNETDISSLF